MSEINPPEPTKTTIIFEVSPEEAAEINRIRENKRLKRAATDLRFTILDAAARFERFMQDTGLGSSYSTFCDDFKFPEHPHRRAIYMEAIALIERATKAADNSIRTEK